MPEVKHSKQMNVPVSEVWDFVKNMDNWAPFLMGYVGHKTINEKESEWKLKSTILGVTYSFQMKVMITEWEEEAKVGFELNGMTHPVKGGGLVTLKGDKNGNSTDVSFSISLNGKGLAAPVVNRVVAPLLEPMARELLDKINDELVKVGAS